MLSITQMSVIRQYNNYLNTQRIKLMNDISVDNLIDFINDIEATKMKYSIALGSTNMSYDDIITHIRNYNMQISMVFKQCLQYDDLVPIIRYYITQYNSIPSIDNTPDIDSNDHIVIVRTSYDPFIPW